MSIVVSIAGRQSSGKSTVAAVVGLLAAYVLKLPESVSLAGKKKEAPKAWLYSALPTSPLVALVHERCSSSALAYEHLSGKLCGFSVRGHRALTSVPSHAAEASGGVLVCDDVTMWYDHCTREWVDQSNAARERAGVRAHAYLGPDAFREINESYYKALSASQREPAVTIQIHREGSEVVPDFDFGLINGSGTRLRGQAEAGSDSHLVLKVEGGFRSGNNPLGERRLSVAADAAQRATSGRCELPALRTDEDLRELRRRLWDLLAPSLHWLRTAVPKEKALWEHLSEPEDIFAGAGRSAEKQEAARLLDQLQTLLAQHGLTSTSGAVQTLVRPMLTDAIGWGSLTAAAEGGVSAEALRIGLEILRAKAPAAAELLRLEAGTKKKASPGANGRAGDPAPAPEAFPDIADLG